MRINFLTTYLSLASGGAIYDNNFYEILKNIAPEVRLFNDEYFINKYNGGDSLFDFISYYRKSSHELLDCDYFIMNSRLYTRFLLLDIKKLHKKYPKTKIIIIHHHSNFMNNSGLYRIVHKHFERKVLESADELIIPNEYVVYQVKKDFKIKEIKYLPSSFEKINYKLSDLNSNILLFVGNIEKRKGIIYGLQAFKAIHRKFPNLKYYIAGAYNPKDEYFCSLQKYVYNKKLNDCVIFEGRVSKERLDWLYENAKLMLFPSLLEGYGWVMIEAMGRGVPVVAFDNSAIPYTVKNNINGLLIRDRDVAEMSSRVCQLLRDERKLALLQEGALVTYNSVPSQIELNKMTSNYIHSWGINNER